LKGRLTKHDPKCSGLQRRKFPRRTRSLTLGAEGGSDSARASQMKFLMQLLLSFLAGLALGYVLLHAWDVMGGLEPFDARYGRW
jgi:hypothetical protein